MRVDPATFEALVARAVDELPDWVHERLENVAILVQPWPTGEQLRSARVEQGHMLLGLYEGIPLTHRGRGTGLTPPDRITLFQRPLEAMAHSEQALVERIRHTIVHEVAHHFGFSDEHLRELGY